MMRWAYQTPIKRAGYYHSHDFCSECWSGKFISDRQTSDNLKYLGENREKVVAWMKTLLKEVPGNERNFVLMDSIHSFSVSENLAVNAQVYNPDFDFNDVSFLGSNEAARLLTPGERKYHGCKIHVVVHKREGCPEEGHLYRRQGFFQ